MKDDSKIQMEAKGTEVIEEIIEKNKLSIMERFTTPEFIAGVVLLYVGILFILLLAELGLIPVLDKIRVTNQVVILFSLIFLPFFIIASSRLVHTISLRLSGQEIRIEMAQIKEQAEGNIERVEKDFSRTVNTAEQALWPMLAGLNYQAEARWANKKIIIGSKEDVSQVFFAHFLKHFLSREIPGIDCEIRVPNGGSLKNFADVKFAWIDLYIDFTGTCCQYFNIPHKGLSISKMVDTLNDCVLPMNMKFMRPLGATENYCIVIKTEVAKDKNIKTLEDLGIKSKELCFSADPEFLNRRDCFRGLVKEYGFDFKEIRQCKVSDRYAYFDDKDVHVFVGYETDPIIKNRKQVKVLKDNEYFFPSYDAIPLVNTGAFKIAGLEDALNKLEDCIQTDDIIKIVHKLSMNHLLAPTPERLAEQHYNIKFS